MNVSSLFGRRRPLTVAAVLVVTVATLLFVTPLGNDFPTGSLDIFPFVDDDGEEEATLPRALRDAPSGLWVEPSEVGVAPAGSVEGILTFRGSPTRSFYGTGPVGDDPEVTWRYPPTGQMCRSSRVGSSSSVWCGTGWTGQPALFRREGKLWAVFGALDGAVHFIDAETGEELLPSFQTGDIIKGSVTVDPDGFPIVYTGSRDNYLRAIAFDGDAPRELWKVNADDFGATLWNNDWDGSPLVLDGHLFIGGENSRIHIFTLDRRFDDGGQLQFTAELLFTAPAWDQELLAAVGENVSIENSVAVSGNTLYFANSGGLVQGWDISRVRDGEDPNRVFRFWVGDDVDASIVVDAEGMLYVAVEFERNNTRSRELGQLLKLDPTREGEDALVWAVDERQGINSGIWGTPALHDDVVIFGSEGGRLRAVDAASGDDLWAVDSLGRHLWQSPVVIDDVLIMGDCDGALHGFDVSDPRVEPPEVWSVQLDEGCIESTPAVWDGQIVVGTRAGAVYGIR